MLAEEPLIEVLCHGVLQIVVDVITQTEEVVEGIEHVADGAGHLGGALGNGIIHRVDIVGAITGEGSFHLDLRMAFRNFAQNAHRGLSTLRIASDNEVVTFLHLQVFYQPLGSEVGIERGASVGS